MRIAPSLSRIPKVLIKRVVGLLAAAFCVGIISTTASAQSAGDYRSAASGNWNATATWERFDGATWVAAVATPTSADGVITIRSGHTVTISASGLSYDQVTVDAGGQVTVASTITHTLANGTGTDLTINGTWLNSGGTWTVTGAAWTVSPGGTYVHNTTSGIATPLGQSTLDAASNFIYRGSSTLTPAVSTSGRTYGNLSFESTSGSYSLALSGAGTLTINGDFTIGTGVTYSTTQSGVMTFAGNFTNNGTLTNSTNTQIYTFTGSGKSISGANAIQFETWNVNLGASIALARDVSIDSTFTGTISGTLECGTRIVSGAGSFTLASGGTLSIGDPNGITSLAASGNIQVAGTRTFNGGANYNYSGGAAQVTGNGLTAGNNITIQNSAGVTLSGNVTVNGTFIVNSGTTLNTGTAVLSGAGVFTLSSSGTLGIGDAAGITSSGATGNIQTGTRNFNTGANYIYNGSAAQVTGNGLPSTVASLTSSNTSTGVTLSQDVTVTGALSITSSTFDQGATFNLTAGSVSVSSGAMWKDIGTGDVTLGGNVSNNGKVDFNGTTTTCGEADAVVITSSVNGTQRTWSGTGVFDFTDVDVKDQNAAIGMSGTIKAIAVSSTDSTGNTNWTFRSSCSPTASRLDSFGATRFDDGTVAIRWQTGLEVDNLGYNIYREAGGKRERVNPQMIAGSALLAGPGVMLQAGRSYNWPDELRKETEVRYWLEEVDLNGASTWHGPVTVERAQPGEEPPPDNGRAMLLSEVGADATRDHTTPLTRFAAPAGSAGGAPASVSLAAFDLAGRSALKLSVNREAWYRVSAADLIAAGLDSNVDPRMLQLTVNGKEQAFIVRGEEDKRLDAADSIEFFGIGVDSQHTDTRVYWLAAGSRPGLRILQVKGKGGKPAPASLAYTVERKDRAVYFSSLRNGEKENFFGAVVTKNPVDQPMTLLHVDPAAIGNATLEIALRGVSLVPHRVSVELNGSTAGEVRFEGDGEGVATFSVNRSALREGQNIVRLAGRIDSDVSLVDYIRITYPHTYAAESNGLRFNLAKKQQAMINGFTSGAIRVLDVTDPDAVTEVSSQVLGRDNNFSVTVSAPKNGGGDRLLWAFADETSRRPVSITANKPSSLRDSTQGADFVIVTHRDFAESLRPLQALRESQGMSVAVVDVEDVFDEFSFGEKSPQAIRDFLLFAKTNWKKPPRFAMLVGDASLDPKNYMGRGNVDFVPTKFIDTKLMETASDDWFADFDGDGIEEMAVGRLPVRTADQAVKLIGKIAGYDGSRGGGVLLISDASDGIDFQRDRSELRQLVPGDVLVEEIDRGLMGTAGAKSQLMTSLARGPKLVNYSGHGSVNLWRGNLLTASDANGLANDGNLSIYFALTCLNGYFVDPVLESLAESLVKAERGGAVAAWASSGLCDAASQAAVNREMFRVIFNSGSALTLGEAAARAKASVTDGDVRRTYILFGDPTIRLR